MDSIKFNFSRLQNIYIQTLKTYDKSVAFDIQVGKGRFLFTMYLSEEDKEARDTLFIFMRNTKVMKHIKMYGNHVKGTFDVYISKDVQGKLIEELQLSGGSRCFDFIRFLNQLNDRIPLEMQDEERIRLLRQNRHIISSIHLVDECDKTVFIGDKKLPEGSKQRVRTLRKLYMYTESDIKDVNAYIQYLYKSHRTVAWTTPDKDYMAADIRALLQSVE